jgi:putative tricarboxylic transport membrane protein
LSYDDERRLGKHADDFGKGAIESVAVPEAANNAAVNGAFVQALTPGVPGSGRLRGDRRDRETVLDGGFG